MKRTYTNKTPVAMDLVETLRPGAKDPDRLHSFYVLPGESVTLLLRPGIRRRWRKN